MNFQRKIAPVLFLSRKSESISTIFDVALINFNLLKNRVSKENRQRIPRMIHRYKLDLVLMEVMGRKGFIKIVICQGQTLNAISATKTVHTRIKLHGLAEKGHKLAICSDKHAIHQ